MSKKYRILKWIVIPICSLFFILITFGVWVINLIPPIDTNIKSSTTQDLPYISQNVPLPRGKILAVVTSMDSMGNSGKVTGYELTELARAYYVFKANGFEVDITSPLGGKPSVIIDKEDMGAYDYAFLNDSIAQHKANHTISVKDIIAQDYKAIYFVGGKGAMFDFPDNVKLQSIIREYYQSNKVIGAVCHGPAALVNVTLDNGKPLIENKEISGFTNKEELLLIPEARSIFPFLLQDKLISQGARFNEGVMYLEKISHDENIITGQNPWSVWALAEAMIKQLGYTPKHREVTDEENAVKVLDTYEKYGTQKAKKVLKDIVQIQKRPINRGLIAKHSVIAMMQGNVKKFFDIINLASYSKKLTE